MWVKTPLALFIGFFLIRTFGQGSLTLIPHSLVPQWFITARGRALSVLALGAALSSAVLPYINLAITAYLGWRAMWIFWGVVLMTVMAPVAWVFTRSNPEELGLRPDGFSSRASPSGIAQAVHAEHSFTLPEAISARAFWLILAVTCIPSMVGTGAQFHHLSIMARNGVGATQAAAVFAIAAAVNLCFTPLAGYLCDRCPVKWVLSGAPMLQAINLVMLLYTSTACMLMALGVVQGIRQGVLSVAGGVVWPYYFGRGHLASIRGVTTTGMVVASASGPMPFGAGYDWFGGYTEVILIMALLPLLGALGILLLKRPQRPDAHASR